MFINISPLRVILCTLLLSASLITNAQFVQESKVVGTGNIGAGQQGWAVAISADGNTMVESAFEDNTTTGAAWVFIRSGGVWTQQVKLVGAGLVGPLSYQGVSVAISSDGNTIAVGSYGEDTSRGVVLMYTRSGTVWSQQAKLVGSGAIGAYANQGYSVSLSSDGNTLIEGGTADNSFHGAAWVFTRSGTTWTQQAKLIGTGVIGTAQVFEGYAVTLSSDGNTAIVGGIGDNNNQGAAWVFTRSGITWTQQTKLIGTGSIGAAEQGTSATLSADGNTLVVGGYVDNTNQGAAWVYTRSGTTWTQQTKLIGTGNIGAALQGTSVSLSSNGNTLAVSGCTDNSNKGAVWIYAYSGGTWTQKQKFVGSGAIGTLAQQGYSVSLSADGNTIVEGGHSDNSNIGAVWVFVRSSVLPTISSFSPTTAGTGNTVTIKGTNFTTTTAVTFGGTAAGSFIVVNDSTITAVVGTGATGSVGVTTSFGTVTLPGFTYCTPVTPSVSVTGSSSYICSGTNITFTAVAINGGSAPGYQWIKNGSNVGSGAATYQDNALNNNDSVWCILTSNATCTTTPTVISNKIKITVTSLNVALSSIGSGCPGKLAVSGVSNGATIQWYNNGNLEHTTAPTGNTVAGGNGAGAALNQFNVVYDVFLDAAKNIYVVDGNNNRVQKFPAGSTSSTNGVTVAGGNGAGSAANQLSGPTGLYIDGGGNLYVVDGNNARIQKFPAGSTSSTNGVTVAGGNGFGSAANQISPSGVYVDGSGNIYVADGGNNRIQKFPSGSTSSTNGITVAGGVGAGSAANQLNFPIDVGLDASGNIYVTDDNNARVQKFPPGSTSGTNAIALGTGTLVNPFGLSIDSKGNVFVTNQNGNSIVEYPAGSTSSTVGITVAGLGGYGPGANQLEQPLGVYVDAAENIYVADFRNERIQEWPALVDTTYTPLAAGSYTAVVLTNINCSATTNAITRTSTNTWLGGGSSDWSNSANWCSGIVPAGASNVIIPTGSIPYPVLSTSVSIDSINIQSGATVTIGSNTLTINGQVTGTGTLSSSPTSNLTIEGAAGIINFTPGSSMHTLLIDNGASAGIGSAVAIASTGSIKTNTGAVLTTNDNLTIKSDINGTAQVGIGSSAGGYINGNVTVERYIPANNNRAWRCLSVPTQTTQTINAAWQEGQTGGTNTVPNYGTIITAGSTNSNWASSGFDYQQAGNSILSYNQSTAGWNDVAATNSPIATRAGYFLYVRGDRSQTPSTSINSVTPTTLRTFGPLYEGDQPAISIPAVKLGLIGNIYASAIDFTGLAITGGVANAFYVWDPKVLSGTSLGVYQIFSAATGWTTPISGGSYGATNSRIESGEAFFAFSTGLAGTIQLKEASKISGSNNAFRPATVILPNAQLKTNLYTISGNTTAQVDANFEIFNNIYADTANSDNVLKLSNAGENFAIGKGSKKLVIESRPSIVTTDTIFYNMWNMQQKQYQLEFVPSNFNKDSTTAYLVDNYLKTKTPLDLTVTSALSFAVNSDSSSYASNRFMVEFKAAPSVVSPITVQINDRAISVFPNPVLDGSVNIKLVNQPAGNYTVRLISMSGQLIYSTMLNSVGNITVSTIELPAIAQGIYRLEIINPSNRTSVQKLIIGKKEL
jgi:hypothetical protein